MQAAAKNARKTPDSPDNAIARKVLEEIDKIDKEAQVKKLEQLDSLQTARNNIQERMSQLQHQLSHIEKAIGIINGQSPTAKRERKPRRNLDEVRERLGRWMESHKGEKYGAGDLAKEFPELEGTPISYVMKPLVESSQVKTDTSAGIRRMKYFVAE